MSTNNIIGKKYEADYEISFEKIKEFVEVLGDNNPHYSDREFVKSIDGGNPYAPPTFAAVYCQPALKNLYFDPDFSKLVPRLVHGEQEYNFVEPCAMNFLWNLHHPKKHTYFSKELFLAEDLSLRMIF